MSDRHQLQKYQALNLLNSKTIEFRVFRGTLNYDTFIASMELCLVIYRYCTTGKNNSEPALNNWSRFIKYLNQFKFINLIEYIDKRFTNIKKDSETESNISSNEISF